MLQARRQKAEKTKTLGQPIQLIGKALDIHIEGNEAWIAENTHVAKKIDLEASGRYRLSLNARRILTTVRQYLANIQRSHCARHLLGILREWSRRCWSAAHHRILGSSKLNIVVSIALVLKLTHSQSNYGTLMSVVSIPRPSGLVPDRCRRKR